MFSGERCVLAACVMCCAGTAAGQVIYDNGAPNMVTGYNAVFWARADDFTLSAPATLAGVRFWTLETKEAMYDGNVQYRIYRGDFQRAPGELIVESNVVGVFGDLTGRVWPPNTDYFERRWDVPLSPLQLPANERFFIALHINLFYIPAWTFWETANANGTTTHFSQREAVGPWGPNFGQDGPNGRQLAFQLLTVPEPTTLAIIGFGAIGILLRKRTFSRTKQ